MPSELILLRQPGLRDISKEDVRVALDDRQLQLEHEWVDIDMRPFADDVAAGEWEAADRFLRERAAEVHRLADELADPEIHYFGLAEVPHIVALGAHLGLERKIVVHDFDRDAGTWCWAQSEPQLRFSTPEIPDQIIPQRGIVPLFVQLSYPVSDGDVAAVIGEEIFPPVRVGLVDEGTGLGRVRSAEDLELARVAVRGALAGVRTAYPNAETLHIFAPVPTSVAFVLGQELVPRNTPPAQTYRYRHDAEPKQQVAILIRETPSSASIPALSTEQRAEAEQLRREAWATALDEVRDQAQRLGARDASGPWYGPLAFRAAFSRVNPFAGLAPLANLVPRDSRVAAAPYPVRLDYRYVDRIWNISDELTVALRDGAPDDTAHRLRVRLFLLHEYLHNHHMITADTAPQVGKFPNALEHVDYTADFYALCHELDRVVAAGEITPSDEEAALRWLRTLVEQVIQSFWAFEEEEPRIWEVRRLRRHLNWYWQLARLGEVTTVEAALRTLARKPVIELAGLHTRAVGRRVEVDLTRFLPQTELEIAVVLEDESLDRRAGGGGTDPRTLCEAIVSRRHDDVKGYFRALERYARVRHPI